MSKKVKLAPQLSPKRHDVYRVIMAFGPSTVREIMQHFPKDNLNNINTIVHSLAGLKLIQKGDSRRCRISHRERMTWEVTGANAPVRMPDRGSKLLLIEEAYRVTYFHLARLCDYLDLVFEGKARLDQGKRFLAEARKEGKSPEALDIFNEGRRV